MSAAHDPSAAPAPKGRILVVFADGKLRRDMFDIARAMSSRTQAAFSVEAGRDLCRETQFDMMLLVGEPRHLSETKIILGLGGWAAEMPIVAVCSGSLDLAEARAAGLSVVIPAPTTPAALAGAITGSMAADGRGPVWWLD